MAKQTKNKKATNITKNTNHKTNTSNPKIQPQKKKKKVKWKNVLLVVILLISIGSLLFSSIKIIAWYKDNKGTADITEKIEEVVNMDEVNDSENTEIIEQEEIPKSNPYWDYIKTPLLNVSFSELKEINNMTVGWIQVKGTNINYPFVQGYDNGYYLNHSFDKSKNNAGWVFMDYRNKQDGNNKNTILYAHGRLDTTMFGSLKNILTSGWLKNEDNYIVRLSTEYENTLWQVFSIYRIPTTNDYIRVEFYGNEDFLSFGNMLMERSAHNFNTTISAYDRILTLSTCYNSTDKVVLHAKLIKKEARLTE